MTQTRTPRFDKYPNERAILGELSDLAGLTKEDRQRIVAKGADLVQAIRTTGKPGLMEVFLAEYGLSTEEGIALMCLAEALLRVPDAETIDALIEDKIAPSDWGKHLGHSSSSLVNASTWALLLTGRVLDGEAPGMTGVLRGAIKRLGEPVIRAAAKQAMREMGQQFVLGETMQSALGRAKDMERSGYTYSYDMLGEAAMTDADARRYHAAYADAIASIAENASGNDIRTRPGISVKLSALHASYTPFQRDRVMNELVPRLQTLLRAAAKADIGLNIDAEEADRLDISLDVIGAAISDPALAGWNGFGVVVQAYGLRAAHVIDHLYALAKAHDRKLMVRLVKGAYWDTEIKRAQIDGMARFPVFTTKAGTDVSYIANAHKLMGMTDRIYPQFATHNAHTVAAILDMKVDPQLYEFQRLHGMGERLHEIVHDREDTRCRIYAPVGAHRDLLAYLVRRLLENGANSSFVNQVVDENVPPELVAADPFDALDETSRLRSGSALFKPDRENSKGWDLTDQSAQETFDTIRAPYAKSRHSAGPRLAQLVDCDRPDRSVTNPADPQDIVGTVQHSTMADVDAALRHAQAWAAAPSDRAMTLNAVADAYEAASGEIFVLLAREAGKTPLDCIGELREAVDFLRYYATLADQCHDPVGIVTCISPWNFPLAIFTGQIAGALAAGCAVLAKPAEQTCLIADLAVRLMHEAGVPKTALQLLPGDGATIGAALTSDPRVAAVAFTGSTATARHIQRAMAENLSPGAPLVAETGGLNAMIVDSTALLEQAVRDVVASAFQSAGQRCSALRCLYVQEDIAPEFREMLFGAMDELTVGDPWQLTTDIGPIIDVAAQTGLADYLDQADIIKQVPAPDTGSFIGPTVVEIPGITALDREIFGPILHVTTFNAHDIECVIEDINSTGYGLTFGLHTRIDGRVQSIVERIECGNVYVNRNQIGAIVGSQPFGGQDLSGTGPKAGGPAYPLRFTKSADVAHSGPLSMPGPTGESNRLTQRPRAPFLCLGPGTDAAQRQADAIRAKGGDAILAPDVTPTMLTTRDGIGGAVFWGQATDARPYARAMAARSGAILPLICAGPRRFELVHERHVSVDTTASGGNAELLANVSA